MASDSRPGEPPGNVPLNIQAAGRSSMREWAMNLQTGLVGPGSRGRDFDEAATFGFVILCSHRACDREATVYQCCRPAPGTACMVGNRHYGTLLRDPRQ